MYIQPTNIAVINHLTSGNSNYRWLPSYAKARNFESTVQAYRKAYREAPNKKVIINKWVPLYKNWLKSEYNKNRVKRANTTNMVMLIQQRKKLLMNLKNVENKLRVMGANT